MVGQRVTFDGHTLNDLFYVGNVDVGLPEISNDFTDRTGDGSIHRGMRLGGVTIVVPLVAKPRGMERARTSIAELMGWLDVDEPRKLSLSADDGLWRMAVPNAVSMADAEWGDRLTVEFRQPDPALYGKSRSVTVPSGGSVTFHVGGTYPTKPTVSGTVTRDGTTHLWGIRLDGGDFVRASVPTSSATAVAIDCDARTCAVGGATTIPTLDSDWLELKPGTHTLQNDQGTGACTVTWHERWHR